MIDPELRRERIYMAVRWIGAVPFLFSIPILVPIWGQVAAWLAPFLTAFGAILISPEIVSFCARRVNNLIFPSRPAERKPNYGIPEALVAKGQYEEAEAEYDRIIADFPDEVMPHTALINIAIRRLKNAKLAENLFKRGVACLKKKSSREILEQVYAGMITQIKSVEEENPPPIHIRHEERPAPILAPPAQRPKWNGPKTKLNLSSGKSE
jgi:hypothetical protein